jgi:cytoskeletal protein RodZ
LESIGEKLRSVREAKKLAIRDVAKDTNIAPRYIEALESEEFDKFPGETYITGFLRSYAEYLKLDADDMIQSYKGYKIGESITPLEELTKPTRPDIVMSMKSFYKSNRYVVFGIVGALFLVIVLFVWNGISSSRANLESDDTISKYKDEYDKEHGDGGFENIHNLKLQNGREVVMVYKNEAVQFIVDSKEVMFVVREIKGKEVTVELLPQKQKETLAENTPRPVTFPGTTKPVMITLKGLTEDRASIKVELNSDDDDQTNQVVAKNTQTTQPVPQGDQTTMIAQNAQNLKITFEAEFTAKTYVEIYLDGNQKTKGVVNPGRKEVWEANSLIQVKIGNAGGVKAKINNKEYSFGLPGQVANKVITWKKDATNPNQYQIVVRDWY